MSTGSSSRRVLVVVDRAILDIDSVPTSVLLAEERADEVYVVTPTLTSRLAWLTGDDAGALRDAEARLVAVLWTVCTSREFTPWEPSVTNRR